MAGFGGGPVSCFFCRGFDVLRGFGKEVVFLSD